MRHSALPLIAHGAGHGEMARQPGGLGVDPTLDVEQGSGRRHGFKRQRRDRGCVLAAPLAGRNVGTLLELAPGMRVGFGRRSRARRQDG